MTPLDPDMPITTRAGSGDVRPRSGEGIDEPHLRRVGGGRHG